MTPPTTLRRIVDEQAEDEALWCVGPEVTLPEAMLQAALRRLHAAVEAACPQQTQREKDEWIRAAYDFIERAQTWTGWIGVDPDEIHELLQSVPPSAI